MDIDYYKLLIGIPIFLFGAGVVAWIAHIENERFQQKIDQKIADEIRRRCALDGISGRTIDNLMPEITHIRHNCMRENRLLFVFTFIVSLVSFFGGAVFILHSP